MPLIKWNIGDRQNGDRETIIVLENWEYKQIDLPNKIAY